MLTFLIFVLSIAYLAMLLVENRQARKHRAALKHVIYINGTRGKSSVTRLIDAGLRAGGLRSYCKTTGTLPMLIDTAGHETLIKRRGKPNIKEQLHIMGLAAKEHADVLVIECMAVNLEYQAVSQHHMVRADIGVITNVRLDHTDVMGQTLPEICDALSNTIPKSGVLFTADSAFAPQLTKNAIPLGTKVRLTVPDAALPNFDFAENLALALGVCAYLGVARETALRGMSHYQRDPYALSLHRIGAGALFIGGLSINDPQSTVLVYNELAQKLLLGQKKVTLLFNTRPDRVARTGQMSLVVAGVQPQAVIILGPNGGLLRRRILKKLQTPLEITLLKQASQVDFTAFGENDVVFAAGNLACQGTLLMDRVRKEGSEYVQ